MAKPKLDYWAKKFQRDMQFNASEIAQGMEHPFLKTMAQFTPGAESTRLVQFMHGAQVQSPDGAVVTLSVGQEDVFNFMEIFLKGMRYAQKNSSHPPVYHYPQNITVKSPEYFAQQGMEGSPVMYVPPTQYANPGVPEPHDSFMLNVILFAQTAYHKQLKTFVADKPHTALKEVPLTWDERIFIEGVEEMRHMYQLKDPQLRERMEREIAALGPAFNQRAYDHTNPLEHDAGSFAYEALMEYRRGKSGPGAAR